MKPLYTLLLCLPAAVAFIACACGLAVLWPSRTRLAEHPTGGRRRSGRSLV
jgi:hypothetical protein